MEKERLVFGSFSVKPYICDGGIYRAQDNGDLEEGVTREELLEGIRKYLGEDKKRKARGIINLIIFLLLWIYIIFHL